MQNGDIFNDLDGPQPGFQGHDIFEVEFLKETDKAVSRVLRTKLL